MSNKNKLSRREWFRLRATPLTNASTESANSTQSPASKDLGNQEGLLPIDLPPNHDGLDLSELPPMREATLSTEQVAALFSDIEQLATEILLMQRAPGAQRAVGTEADNNTKLALAKSALLSGSVTRLQIRYRWQGQQWIDTLKQNPSGFHIVRIAHQGS